MCRAFPDVRQNARMLATFQALAVFITTLLPGALFTLAFERESNGSVKADANERILSFAAVSAFFAVFSAPLLYQGYRLYVVSGDLHAGHPLPWWVWFIAAFYVFVPPIAGGLLGRAIKDRADEKDGAKAKMLRMVGGPLNGSTPSPRAWERLFFTPGLSGYVKIKLKDAIPNSNPWILGVWAKPDGSAKRPGSYASGYPYDQDIYFFDTCEIDDDGTIASSSATAIVPVKTGIACIISWSEVAYAEFIEA